MKTETNETLRLETFCDGVFAIAITLLVIDIKIPETAEITTPTALWQALWHIMPAIFAFLLSFAVILITWVNHHNHLKLIDKSCNSFLYANGFLLLTVAFIPFPTSMLGEYLFTDHSAPAVVLYNAVLALQAIGWILISQTAFRSRLEKVKKRSWPFENGRFGYFAGLLYSLFAVLACWFPQFIALMTTFTWVFWLIYGINIKHEDME